ncbi:MAG: hypothetical protein SNJ75_09000 [Gemmataceae bacterium]
MGRRFVTLAGLTRLSGISRGTLEDWLRRGLFPAVTLPGSARKSFSTQTLIACVVARRLMDIGLDGEPVWRVVRFLSRADLDQRVEAGQRWLLLTRQQCFLCNEESRLERVSGVGPHAFVIVDLDAVRKALPSEEEPQVQVEQVEELEVVA